MRFQHVERVRIIREWSQYSKENVWRRQNNGEQVLNNIGLPCGKKILDSDDLSWIEIDEEFLDKYFKDITKDNNEMGTDEYLRSGY